MKNSIDRRVDTILSSILTIGVVISLFLVILGSSLFLISNGKESVDFNLFIGEPSALKEVSQIIQGAWEWDNLSLIQLGILVLIIIPVIRVATCIVIFIIQQDYLYVFISTIVLSVLIFSLLSHT